jgi:hypothetical protein
VRRRGVVTWRSDWMGVLRRPMRLRMALSVRAFLGMPGSVVRGRRRFGRGTPRRWMAAEAHAGGRMSEGLGSFTSVLVPCRVHDPVGRYVKRRQGRPVTEVLTTSGCRVDVGLPFDFDRSRAHDRDACGSRRKEIGVGAEDVTRCGRRKADRDGDSASPDEERGRGRPAHVRVSRPPFDPRGCVLSTGDPRPAKRPGLDPSAIVKWSPAPFEVARPNVVVSVDPVAARHVGGKIGADFGRTWSPDGPVRGVVRPGAVRVERGMKVLERGRIFVVVGIGGLFGRRGGVGPWGCRRPIGPWCGRGCGGSGRRGRRPEARCRWTAAVGLWRACLLRAGATARRDKTKHGGEGGFTSDQRDGPCVNGRRS